MENAKKMIIVSQEALQRVNQQQGNQTTRHNDTVSELDREMLRLLNDKTLSDTEKWNQYQQVLQRYLHFASQNRKPLNLPVLDLNESGQSISINAISDESIVETFTKTYKQDVRNFLKAIENKTDLIKWDKSGSVYIRGTQVPNSNIIDLIHDVIRARKSTKPPGWEQLLHVLKEINIPNEFVTNPVSRQYLTQLKAGDSITSSGGTNSFFETSQEFNLDTPPGSPKQARSLRSQTELKTPTSRKQYKWEPFVP